MDTIIDRSVDVSDFTEAGGLLFGPGISEGSMGLVQKTAGGIVVKQATARGYIEAVDGDGVSLAFPGSATRRGRVIHQKSHTITCACDICVFYDNVIRHFTVEELEKLQGLPTSYTAVVPEPARKRAIGNGWTASVIYAPTARQQTASSWPERRKHMNQTTKETRRRSYDAVLPKRAARCRLILETLGNRELTASEITEELVAAGRIPYFNRNYVAPRLTELKEIGILTTVGRRKATRSDATEAVWARAEPSGPTGQTAAAYADNPTEAEQMTLGSAT